MRMFGRIIGGVVLAAGVVIAGAAAASAAEGQAVEPSITSTGASPNSPSASEDAFPPPDPDRYPSLDVPTESWAYETDYYFALTRGLTYAGVESRVARGFAMLGTVPMDIVTLPGAMLAGLWGT